MTDAFDRRRFFREGLSAALQPLAHWLAGRQRPIVLRPPGALPEAAFLDTCQRCGDCIAACPAQAIQPFVHQDPRLARTPIIDPNTAACVVCTELACMPACPTGALRVLTDPAFIDMGLAVVDFETCTRTHGDDCTACVDLCPLGSKAITLDDDGRVAIATAGCVGCGVCQLNCPTTPRAIHVEPTERIGGAPG